MLVETLLQTTAKFVFDQSGSWTQAKCFWQQREQQIAEGEYHEAGWHYSPDRIVWTAPIKIGKERGGQEWWSGGKVREKSVFALSVCGDEEWEGGKVNMGHSLGLMHVLPSGWKRKWLGPITAPFFSLFFFFYNWSHCWWDVPFWLAFTSIQCLLLWSGLVSSTHAGEWVWSWQFYFCAVPAFAILHTHIGSASLSLDKMRRWFVILWDI